MHNDNLIQSSTERLYINGDNDDIVTVYLRSTGKYYLQHIMDLFIQRGRTFSLIDLDDLKAELSLVLVKANINYYRTDLKVKQVTYIYGAFRNYLNDYITDLRSETNYTIDIDLLEETLEIKDSGMASYEQFYCLKEWFIKSELTLEEQRVCLLHVVGEMSLDETGERLGLSKQQVWRRFQSAAKKLRC